MGGIENARSFRIDDAGNIANTIFAVRVYICESMAFFLCMHNRSTRRLDNNFPLISLRCASVYGGNADTNRWNVNGFYGNALKNAEFITIMKGYLFFFLSVRKIKIISIFNVKINFHSMLINSHVFFLWLFTRLISYFG